MKALKKEQKIIISDREITVSKLSLGKVAKLLESIGKIPELNGLEKQDNDEVLENIPLIIAGALPKFVKPLEIATNNQVDEDFLMDECGIDDVIELVYAILEVNNVSRILKTVKKMKALNQTS